MGRGGGSVFHIFFLLTSVFFYAGALQQSRSFEKGQRFFRHLSWESSGGVDRNLRSDASARALEKQREAASAISELDSILCLRKETLCESWDRGSEQAPPLS